MPKRTPRSRSGSRNGSSRAKPSPVSLGGAGVDVRFAMIDNPYHDPAFAACATNPRRIRASRNVNESPLVRLHHFETIDDLQARAGFRFRALYERVMLGGPSPSNLCERVDGSGGGDIFTDARADALHRLAHVAGLICADHLSVLRAVAGEGRTLRSVRGKMRCRSGDELRLLKQALDRLVEIWGMKAVNGNRRSE